MAKFEKKNIPSRTLKILDQYPEEIQDKLLAIRALIIQTSKSKKEIGRLQETLKWGEIAFLTPHSKSGSTIRLGWISKRKDHYAIYFNCQTSLIQTFRSQYGTLFHYEKNRAITFHKNDRIPRKELSHCILLALTYHLRKITK